MYYMHTNTYNRHINKTAGIKVVEQKRIDNDFFSMMLCPRSG